MWDQASNLSVHWDGMLAVALRWLSELILLPAFLFIQQDGPPRQRAASQQLGLILGWLVAGCKRKLGDRDPQGLQLEQVQPENSPNGQLVPSAYGTADAIWALPQQNDWSQVELAVEPGFLDFLCEREQLGALAAGERPGTCSESCCCSV